MNTNWIKRAFGDPLGRRLVVYSLLISTVLSTIAAGIQLSHSYQRQREDVSAIFDQIEEALASPLEKALWKFDFGQVDVILDGIFANDAVATLTLSIPSGQTWQRGEGARFDLENLYTLIHVDQYGQEIVVGKLTAFLTLDEVNSLIWAQFWTLLASNLIKAYISASLMLVLFYLLVTRHLKAITRYIARAASEAGPCDLRLARPPKHTTDDLDNIATALNQYRHRLAEKIADLRSEIVVRERAEAEAQKAFEVRKVFLANMSHEVRTPLNAIIGLFQLIQMSDAPERQKKQAEVGLNASHHLLSQLINVLEISRMEADSVDVKIQKEALQPLTEQWLQTAIATLHRLGKPIEISLDIADGMPEFWHLDARRVTQIVNNLTDNALKFTEKGKVDIRIGLDAATGQDGSDQLAISISDTGCGIADHQRATIFDRFVQIDSSETRENTGSGLGLTISRELADLMGATLGISALPKDSCYMAKFTLKLPFNFQRGG
ncbi:sensory box histidine kinase/response regulator [Candidatus Rhodobacter oscarellae]|uniref:histidine kinase n=1 Tax=Candidatus Rhodobacter oscarellae TaxID=1675527 RepID=A0A0J9E362_9RHOB|nr:ATP-binding protein [Candidatus Rhodobacter lobularis]KMW57185.1 sensory box histidine kinase/response regulator [Candidatus Rhodobacter lobularis]